jgi:hypothetical protein
MRGSPYETYRWQARAVLEHRSKGQPALDQLVRRGSGGLWVRIRGVQDLKIEASSA